ncbi:MAG: FAD-dependent oxidoreductase [Pseudomonadota bacterium]|nr:FAD-dependent oxidoreductase [Pseudomonadota bacterium]
MNSSSQQSIADLSFDSLNTVSGLQQLDQNFLAVLANRDPSLHRTLLAYRQQNINLTAIDLSEFLLALAPYIEAYIALNFGIENETEASHNRINNEKAIHVFKKQFVQRRSRRYRGDMDIPFTELDQWLNKQISNNEDRELAVSQFAIGLLEDTEKFKEDIRRLIQWVIHIRKNNVATDILENWVSFKLPALIDYAQLVPLEDIDNDPVGRCQASMENHVRRDGFSLTDQRMNLRQIMGEINYCIYCHDHDGDFCSRGFPENKKDSDSGFRVNPLGETLTGCPLGEKISEMHLLKRDGYDIAALAMATRDNPMLPATGHRICNDCMKSCIYQKQDPVNIPEVETGILTDVLKLTWGVEIYLLLVRWNPLRQEQYLPEENNKRRVLVVGLGPAGFTMAHYLSMAGCNVTGVDGLKLEPLDEHLLMSPIRNYSSIVESLDDRVLSGFGGVAEYGITVRWDKNFLKLIYISLARRKNIGLSGGVRFGGTLTIEDAWEQGFEHISIANGAGLPRVIPMINSLARGMRQANDFLMALQLTGAAKFDSLANLQVRLPAVVIGGGLTAIDTATELQSYYIRQVEKALIRFTILDTEMGREKIFAGLDKENQGILETFLEHGKAVVNERKRAAACNEKPDFLPLLRQWGGVTLTYRRGLNESPAYLRNHDEVVKALQEGIYYAEGVEPVEAMLDEYGHVSGLRCRVKQQRDGRWLASEEQVLPARAIMVAAGASPNTIYENEYPGSFKMEGNHFLPHICHPSGVQPVAVAENCKVDEFGPFTSYAYQDKRISFIGDTHPVFHGSVVKAIASSQRTYPEIIKLLDQQTEDPMREEGDNFTSDFQQQLSATVDRIDASHPAVVEIWVRAPMAAKNFQPGQFFRLQTFEKYSRVVAGTRLQIPLQTVSGAGVEGDCVRLLLLRFGANARIAEQLKPGDPLVLMGPTGSPAELGHQRTVLVIAGAWGAAVMIDLGRALRAAGNRVLFFASFRCQDDIYFKDELEQCADQIVWASTSEALIECRRPQDSSIQQANIIQLIKDYDNGSISTDNTEKLIKLSDVDEIMIMGSTGLLKSMQHSLKDDLKPLFKRGVHATGTVGSPMQCMMKGVCGQCLQWQIDPATGKRTRAVFSCAKQDQPLSWIDLENLAARQSQNRLSEYMTGLWANHVLQSS